jgi:hypothetical protein
MSQPEIIVEIRVPTFRRPDLLIRALESLRLQTWQKWRAVVVDDSPAREGQWVTNQIGDNRILYQANLKNLGRIENLNYCFRPEPFFAESTHACVLEDDNWYDTTWLEANLQAMIKNQALVLARNYRLWDVAANGHLQANPDSVMARLHGSTAGWLTLTDRVRESFFNYSVGNLAYLWQLHVGIDISMQMERYHVHVAETGRSVCFPQPCWFEPEPMASFSRFMDKRQTPSGESPATVRLRRLAKVSEIMFTRKLHALWEKDCGQHINQIITAPRQEGSEALSKLAEAGCPQAFLRLAKLRTKLAAVKSWIVLFVYYRSWQQSRNTKI